MGCVYCGELFEHDSRCLKYISLKSKYICSICNNDILLGDRYIENDDKKFAHWECVDYAKDLAEFLGYKIKEMKDENIY